MKEKKEKVIGEKTKKSVSIEKKKVDKSENVEKKKVRRKRKGFRMNTMLSKIRGLIALGVVTAVTATIIIMISYTKELVIDSAYGKMLNMASSYGTLIDREEEKLDQSITTQFLTTEQYTEILGDMKITGLNDFYYYVLSQSGIIKYHVDETKIGKPNTNSAITTVIGEIANGHRPESLCMEFEENGEKMYASYYITSNKSIMIICASDKELMRPIVEMSIMAISVAMAVLIIVAILSSVVTKRFTRPLELVTDIINDTAKLRIKLPEDIDKLCDRRDETGSISRAVKKMSVNLYDVINRIERTNNNIRSNMVRLEESSNQIHMFCTDNSATTDELAASIDQASNMTQMMNRHVADMRTQAEEIGKETEASNSFSVEVAGRAEKMQSSTQSAIAQTKSLYEDIRTKSETALAGLTAVEKISELTDAIVEISDQTSMLALNASIEAARAGEAGKGFAVVAQEISKLAQRSLATINDIHIVVNEVNQAVTNITETMENTIGFLESEVLADYDDFDRTGVQYMKDAETFKETMNNISKQITALNDSIRGVWEAVETISVTMSETSVGVNDIADKTSNVVDLTSENYKLTANTIGGVNELHTIVERFEYK